jgi:DNA-binding response OmpR family regulator
MAKVIVVDDDSSNITLLEIFLDLEGYEVTSSTDIEQAKTLADEETDAFLIDCNLARGANGLDLLRDIRQGKTAASSDAIVIMTSGDYRRESESMEAGADHFLLKPYPPDQLSKYLSQLMAAKGNHGK